MTKEETVIEEVVAEEVVVEEKPKAKAKAKKAKEVVEKIVVPALPYELQIVQALMGAMVDGHTIVSAEHEVGLYVIKNAVGTTYKYDEAQAKGLIKE